MLTHLVLPWELSSATAMLPPLGEGRVLFLDSPSKGTALPFHRKKLVLVLSASRHFEQELREAGHEVHRRMGASYAEGIRDWLREHPDDQVVVQQPAEWGIAQSIGAVAAEDPRVGIVPDRRFVVSREEFADWAAGRRGEVPLQSAEGFIRQIIGWREYVNGIYWLKMPDYRRVNYFGFTRPLPQLYWEPEQTDLACLRDTIALVQQHAFVHHIPRLMILCNFAVLTGVNPGALSDWFWAAFADAMEWVELPNVVGMGTFGDGGLMASKPYVSSSSYINRMSDHCGGCRYDPAVRTGPTACPFNYLYWSFLDDIRQGTLDVGQRMALVLKALERIPAAELAAMREERERFVAGLVPDRMGWVVRHDQG